MKVKLTYIFKPIPRLTGMSSAFFAYLCASLARLSIDVVGEWQMLGCTGQFPRRDVNSGRPNSRFWTLKLFRKDTRWDQILC